MTDTTADNPFRYCGEYYDSETGFIYLRNRYYDTTTGRFITEDPVKDGLNWYVYCGNNPVMFVDPSGLAITDDDIKAYQEGKLSDNYWDLLNKADSAWNMASEYDYSTKAAAHFMATNIRRMYNSNIVDDFDYTFGTGASALDEGGYGNYVKTLSYKMADGSGGTSILYYSRVDIKGKPYIKITSVGAYSFSGRRYSYNGIRSEAGQTLNSVGVICAGWTDGNYVNENVNLGLFPDYADTDFIEGGTTSYFHFISKRGESKTFSITNNIYNGYYIDENRKIQPFSSEDINWVEFASQFRGLGEGNYGRYGR